MAIDNLKNSGARDFRHAAGALSGYPGFRMTGNLIINNNGIDGMEI